MLDLSPPPTMADVQIRGPEPPPWDITAGLDAFLGSELAPETRTEAVVLMVRDWLIGHGYPEAPTAPEEAH